MVRKWQSRKRATPRRPARKRYTWRGMRNRTNTTKGRLRRYSRYPSRARGPGRRVVRHFNTVDHGKIYSINLRNRDFDIPSGRTFKYQALMLTDIQGVRNDQRTGREVFLHGFRFLLNMNVKNDYVGEWQNGHVHFALCQATDDSLLAESKKPTFSSPIGDATNDFKDIVPIDDANVHPMDLRFGKLKNDEWKVITHRKYYLGKKQENDNEHLEKTMQFYIPIKKNAQFETATDQYGIRPFFVLIWYIPANNIKVDNTVDRDVEVYLKHSTYFKLKN